VGGEGRSEGMEDGAEMDKCGIDGVLCFSFLCFRYCLLEGRVWSKLGTRLAFGGWTEDERVMQEWTVRTICERDAFIKE